jgi:hypothetical protein
VRSAYRRKWERNHEEQKRLFQAHQMDHVLINAAEPYDRPLLRFFEERARKHH